MGIPGLTKFMNDYPELWPPVRSQDWNHLVVDGCNVCYALYNGNYSWLLGGEYKAYSLHVRKFFEELKIHFKNPVVVIDGGKFGCGVQKTRNKPNKRDTVSEKMYRLQRKEKWEIRNATGHNELNIPRMLISVFKDVLRSLDIDLYVVESDADNIIAGLARHYECPVLSSDAIFEVAGFIQLEHWLHEKLNAPMYKIDMFMKQFGLVEHEQCILIPAILGNDFIQIESGVGHAQLSIQEHLLNIKCCSCHEFLKFQDPTIRQRFEEAKIFYVNDIKCPPHFPHTGDSVAAAEVTNEKASTSTANSICESPTVSCHEVVHIATSVTDASIEPLPSWAFKEFESGCFLTYLIKMHHVRFYRLPKTIEVIEKKSAWKISRGIRQFLYGFLGIPPDTEVHEIIREDYFPRFNDRDPVLVRNFVKNPLTITDPIFTDRIFTTPDCRDKLQDLVLTVLNCHNIPRRDIQQIFKYLNNKWKLPIAATFYWYHHESTPQDEREDLLKSLLLSFLTCSEVITKDVPPLLAVDGRTKECHLTALHAFAQWQCVYFDAMALNYLAREPFPTTSPASLYSGEVAMHYATVIPHERHWIAHFITEDSEGWDLYNNFFYLITSQSDDSWSDSWSCVRSSR